MTVSDMPTIRGLSKISTEFAITDGARQPSK
jgi:hypothetical protein